jgi:transposase
VPATDASQPAAAKPRLIVAVQHTILTIIWNMAHTGELSNDLGADYYSHLRPDRTKTSAIRQLEALGYTVTLQYAG